MSQPVLLLLQGCECWQLVRSLWGLPVYCREFSWLSGPLVHSRWVIPVFLTRQGNKIKSPSEQSSQPKLGNVSDVFVNTAAEASKQAGRQLLNYL